MKERRKAKGEKKKKKDEDTKEEHYGRSRNRVVKNLKRQGQLARTVKAQDRGADRSIKVAVIRLRRARESGKGANKNNVSGSRH